MPIPSEIDPGGPVDPMLAPQPVTDVDRPAAFTLMATGWWPPLERITQAYGLCFTGEGLVVLVGLPDHGWTLPGGTVEPGEYPSGTLVREVHEEACARVVRCRYLASQHVWDPQAPDGHSSHYQARFWARVELGPWEPRHETVERRLVPPAQVPGVLFWQDKLIIGRLVELAERAETAAGTADA
jgi:ADP-ribose pyrophosphatase YjhB (NUDIX family)